MNNIIAVYMQENGQLDSFLSSDKIVVYALSNSWCPVAAYPLDRKQLNSPQNIRRQVKEILDLLGGCQIIAGWSLGGVAYNEFNKNGCHIFDIEAVTDEVLNAVMSDVEESRRKGTVEMPTIPVCIDTINGVYEYDLDAAQRDNPALSSKSALRGFFSDTPFSALRLRCRHVPPWIDDALYDIVCDSTSSELIDAVIRKKKGGV
ncbi:Fe-only nitrogenase accessory AnfO family protein [Oscillospiraceae bacterium WX1]